MENTNSAMGKSFGRRAFLKGSAAALGVAALAGVGCSPEEPLDEAPEQLEAPAEELYQGVCRGNCGGGCRMNVHVRDGKVVKTSAIPAEEDLDSRLCQRGLSHAQRMYDPDRIQYPMRRVEGTERGAGEWERITWEDAISEIATKWSGYIAEFGGTSIGMNFGAGTYAYNQYVYQHLFNQFGGVNYDSGYDMAALNVGKQVFGRGIYLHGNHHSDTKDSKVIFAWGNNSTVAQITRWSYLSHAIKNGAKMVVVNPTYTDAAQRADIWVPIKPGTDAALALAMIKVMIDEGLHDEVYLAKKSVAPLLVKEDHCYLRMSDLGVEPTEGPLDRTGKPTVIDPYAVCAADGTFGPVDEVVDPVITGVSEAQGVKVTTAFDLLKAHVQEWTIERTAEFCEIDADVIPELARLYCEGPTTLEIGFGVDHRSNGASASYAILCLPIVSGQIGKTGAGVGGTMGQATMGTHCVNFMTGMFPEKPVYMQNIYFNKLPELVETNAYGQQTIVPKSLINFAGNTLSNISGRMDLLKALEKIELFICCETYMNDTARHADIVLPVPHWFEYETFITCPTPWALFNDESVPPPFECKTDVEICRLIAEAMGLDSSAYASDAHYNSLFLIGDAAAAWDLTWDRLKEEKSILVCPIPYKFGDVEDPDFKFSNVTGRAAFYLENPRPHFDYGQECDPTDWRLPTQMPTLEAYNPDNPLAQKYPFALYTQRDRLKVHAQFATHPWFAEIESEPGLYINQVDAEAKGIAEGDYVRVFNDRGHVVLKAHIDAAVRPGMLRTEHTWWDKQYKDGSYPTLLPSETYEMYPATHPYDAAVDIEKTTVSE